MNTMPEQERCGHVTDVNYYPGLKKYNNFTIRVTLLIVSAVCLFVMGKNNEHGYVDFNSTRATAFWVLLAAVGFFIFLVINKRNAKKRGELFMDGIIDVDFAKTREGDLFYATHIPYDSHYNVNAAKKPGLMDSVQPTEIIGKVTGRKKNHFPESNNHIPDDYNTYDGVPEDYREDGWW